jgi:putative oxidoreductase
LENPDVGLLFIRLALAAVFINAGWAKINNIEGVIGFFGTLGISSFFAYVVAYVEFLGGIAFLLGIWVRYFGLAVAFNMLVAIYKVHWENGFSLANGGYEQVLVLMLMALTLVTTGAGKYTAQKLLRR